MAERGHNITLQPEGNVFEVREGELILDAALRQGIEIAHSCRNGTCRTCLFQVLSGEVEQEDLDLCMITEQELDGGRRLLCMSTLKSEAELEKVQPRRRRAAASE